MTEEPKPHDLNYATPPTETPLHWGGFVKGLGKLAVVAGVITAIAATAGVDDKVQITTGCVIAGFGVTWAILGQILGHLESR